MPKLQWAVHHLNQLQNFHLQRNVEQNRPHLEMKRLECTALYCNFAIVDKIILKPFTLNTHRHARSYGVNPNPNPNYNIPHP